MSTGWWFGTCFILPYIGKFIIPTDELHHFSEEVYHQAAVLHGMMELGSQLLVVAQVLLLGSKGSDFDRNHILQLCEAIRKLVENLGGVFLFFKEQNRTNFTFR